MITFDIDIKGLDDLRDEIEREIGADGIATRNEIGANAVVESMRRFYAGKDADFWSNKSLPTHGAGRMSTRWHTRLSEHWSVGEVSADGVTVSFGVDNETIGLARKIEGGSITSLRASALTIPMIPRAHGRTVAMFKAEVGDLFRPKGKDYLAYNGEDGFRVAYLLRKSVKVNAREDGILSDDEITDSFLGGWLGDE